MDQTPQRRYLRIGEQFLQIPFDAHPQPELHALSTDDWSGRWGEWLRLGPVGAVEVGIDDPSVSEGRP